MARWWFALLFICVAGDARAAADSWTGVVSDSACGAKHEEAAEGADKMPDRDCTLVCVHGGSKFVLVSAGNVYKIANQTFPELPASAGHAVKITGELKDGVITITRIDAP